MTLAEAASRIAALDGERAELAAERDRLILAEQGRRTSRDVAVEAGVSYTYVARLWRATISIPGDAGQED